MIQIALNNDGIIDFTKYRKKLMQTIEIGFKRTCAVQDSHDDVYSTTKRWISPQVLARIQQIIAKPIAYVKQKVSIWK